MSDGKVYEMLWDCQFCGTKKNLGLTHRFCPNCSAPQNPDSRYYPSDEEKVEVHDHKFVGVDVTCPACNELNSAAAEFCGQCGSPLTEGARAKTLDPQWRSAHEKFKSSGSRDVVKEQFQANLQPTTSKAPTVKKKRSPKNPLRKIAIIAVLIAIFGAAFAAFNLQKDVTVVVTEHEWERSISIQEYDSFRQSSWRDSPPSGDNVSIVMGSCREEQRSTRRVADGQTCRTVRQDNGDGTFSERQECTTNYREEPVYDTMCTWSGNRWQDDRTERTSGDYNDPPYWPDITLKCENDRRVGCEREDGRNQQYSVRYDNVEGNDSYRCNYNQDEWEAIPPESRWSGQARALLPGMLSCDTLTRQ